MDKSTSKESSHPCDNPPEKKTKEIEFPWKILLLLVLGYLMIYLLFFTQIGLPSGDGLSNKDWLSFLGGYMSFAGSLIMSIMVYRQEKRLAKLTVKQSNYYLECAVEVCEFASQDFYSEDKTFYVPRICKESKEYNDRFYYSKFFSKELVGNVKKSSQFYTLILSTAMYCSQNATVQGIVVACISLFQTKKEESKGPIVQYKNKSPSVSNRISQTHNQLLLSLFLPDFPALENGKYKLHIDVNYDTIEEGTPKTIIIDMEIEDDCIYIIDGIENPRIPRNKLYI